MKRIMVPLTALLMGAGCADKGINPHLEEENGQLRTQVAALEDSLAALHSRYSAQTPPQIPDAGSSEPPQLGDSHDYLLEFRVTPDLLRIPYPNTEQMPDYDHRLDELSDGLRILYPGSSMSFQTVQSGVLASGESTYIHYREVNVKIPSDSDESLQEIRDWVTQMIDRYVYGGLGNTRPVNHADGSLPAAPKEGIRDRLDEIMEAYGGQVRRITPRFSQGEVLGFDFSWYSDVAEADKGIVVDLAHSYGVFGIVSPDRVRLLDPKPQ